jgi:hypothetical protein
VKELSRSVTTQYSHVIEVVGNEVINLAVAIDHLADHDSVAISM